MTTTKHSAAPWTDGCPTADTLEEALVIALDSSRALGGAAYHVLREAEAYRIALQPFAVLAVATGRYEFVASVESTSDAQDGTTTTAAGYPTHLSANDIAQLEQRRTDPAWDAALHILTFDPLRGKPGIWRRVDQKAGIDFEAIFADAGYLSGGERRLIQIAASCYTSGEMVNLLDVLANLSETWLNRAIEAMRRAAGY